MEKVVLPWQKRLFDVLVGGSIAVVASPVALLIVVAMLIEGFFKPDSGGPVLYHEIRISRGEKFNFYKFRIFKVGALAQARTPDGVIHTKKLEHTPSAITWTGRILKQIYLDELPQLINVLRGDMSLVGPRPTNPVSAQDRGNGSDNPLFLIKAGVTGYFQSHKGLKLSKNQQQLDMEYVTFVRTSPWWRVIAYDTKILCITMVTILRAEGI